jgi:hypothetical protein
MPPSDGPHPATTGKFCYFALFGFVSMHVLPIHFIFNFKVLGGKMLLLKLGNKFIKLYWL